MGATIPPAPSKDEKPEEEDEEMDAKSPVSRKQSDYKF